MSPLPPTPPQREAAPTAFAGGQRRNTLRRGLAGVRALVLAAVLAPAVPVSGQTPEAADADALVASWVDQARIPGAVLLVVQDGRVVIEKAYGWRQLGEPSLPMSRGTVFDLASVTKVMATTFAVMLLVDGGRVALDAPVAEYLPDFRGGGKETITIRHLLTHRSGLPQWVPTYYHADNAADAYAYIRDLPLGWPVGEGRHYSDLGFMVLGRLVERVAGESLDRFLAAEFYGPLGLSSIGFRPRGTSGPDGGPYAATSHGNPYERRMVYDADFGYRIPGNPAAWDGWRLRTLVGEVNDGNAWHAFRGVAGHAGLFSTARELGVLLQLLLNRGEVGGRRSLSPETVATFLTATGDGQALGWQVPDYAPAGSFAHTGFTGTWVLGVPARGLAVVLLTNRQNAGVDERGTYPDLGPLQRGVAEALLGR